MAAAFSEKTCCSAPVSGLDKQQLIELVKEHIEVINDKSTKFYSANKKALAWQEIARKFSDVSGYKKTPQQVRKIWENIKNRTKKVLEGLFLIKGYTVQDGRRPTTKASGSHHYGCPSPARGGTGATKRCLIYTLWITSCF
ncbi:uncharacterized protein LOC123499626 [Portunus trituberculatus]|nr:uncharacterized protein LOC123499626 [Portunus trituberculatus]